MKRRGAASVSLFPAMLKLEKRKCVVVGAGRIAADKVAGLLQHGADVVVISPRADSRIRSLARARRLVWRRRRFSARDVVGALLVVAATNSSLANEAVFRACRACGVFCNVVDDAERCDFFYPAVVRRGPLQIAISTSGRSPALAARLRRELEQQFGPEWGAWVERVGQARRELLRQAQPGEARRRKLLEIVSPQAFRAFTRERAPKKSARRRPAKPRS
jgi:precorrin-2 dehydrogenase/sirohydrochlorin ferrochelatase